MRSRTGRDEKPDFLLVDSMAGGNNGCAFVEEMRRTETGPARVPVLVLGESSDVEAKISAFRAGADDYLSKPLKQLGRAARPRQRPGGQAAPRRKHRSRRRQGHRLVRSRKGGVGTTTLAINSAIALHRDMDPSACWSTRRCSWATTASSSTWAQTST